MNYNKITMDDEVLMDLTEDTVTEEVLLMGYTAHNRSGQQIEGSFELPMNSKRSDGMVEAGEGHPNQYWGTDLQGNPGWKSAPVDEAIKAHDLSPDSHQDLRKVVNKTSSDLNTALKNMQYNYDKTQEYLDSVSNDLSDIRGTQISKTDIVNNLDSSEVNKPLSANMGRELKSQISNVEETLTDDLNGIRTDFIPKADIIDGLTSSETKKPLSANMGRELKVLINGISTLVTELTTRLNAIADSDDETLDQMSEIVAYIKDNRDLIDSITTSKVNVSDIVNNLDSSEANKPLSANMGRELKSQIDGISTSVDGDLDDLRNDLVPKTDITNNLTSNSTNKPLSANMGRELKSQIDGITAHNVTSVNGKEGTVTISAADLDALTANDNVLVKRSDEILGENLDTFVSRKNGVYGVSQTNRSDLLAVLSRLGGSCSSLEFLMDHRIANHDSLKVRVSIDNNRYSEWKHIAFNEYVDSLYNQLNQKITAIQNKLTPAAIYYAAIYYDSTNGNDNNSGSISSPVKTLTGIINIINSRLILNIDIWPVNSSDTLTIDRDISSGHGYLAFNTNLKIVGNRIITTSAIIINNSSPKTMTFVDAATLVVNGRGGQCFIANILIKHSGASQNYNVCHLSLLNSQVLLNIPSIDSSNIVGIRLENCIVAFIDDVSKAWLVSTHNCWLPGSKNMYNRIDTADNMYVART